MKNNRDKYLNWYAEKGPWQIKSRSLERVENAVIIPALAEYPGIIETLHSLALNAPDELKRTLIICVINNRPPPCVSPSVIANNEATLSLMEDLIQGKNDRTRNRNQAKFITDILDSAIRIGYVDASSPGLELPEHAGVGLARKIGMDLCLKEAKPEEPEKQLFFSLDADTLVEPDYLESVCQVFERHKKFLAAVVSFSHRNAEDANIQEAIDFYEVYMRYHVLGLQYAESPYAFHTIGSTIVCRQDAYAMVRGMPKRLAAEDFYFLNKLAKLGTIGTVTETRVYPSPRLSARTPFGTGNKMGQLISQDAGEKLLYNPEVYRILKRWLQLIAKKMHADGHEIMELSKEIDVKLPEYLRESRFVENWCKLRNNDPRWNNLLTQFHIWFDGLKTLRMIHYLTEHGHPKQTVHKALISLCKMIEPGFAAVENMTDHPSMTEILLFLRSMEMSGKEETETAIFP